VNESVRYEREGPVAWVTIDRPEARNALNEAVRTGLFDAVARFNADDAAVLVLTGSGDQAFCAGGDLKEMADLGLEVPPPDFLPIFGRNVTVEKPTIAAVNGVAFAGGFLLAQMCDLCVAAEHARFGITEVKVGRGAPWAMPLPWLVPPRVALALLLTGDPIDAATAADWGLVNRAVPPEELDAASWELLERATRGSSFSKGLGKQSFYAQIDFDQPEAYEYATEVMASSSQHPDAQEGVRAFLEKRRPVFDE
jgi:enoyl-CoA hydratase/carnithine racemase